MGAFLLVARPETATPGSHRQERAVVKRACACACEGDVDARCRSQLPSHARSLPAYLPIPAILDPRFCKSPSVAEVWVPCSVYLPHSVTSHALPVRGRDAPGLFSFSSSSSSSTPPFASLRLPSPLFSSSVLHSWPPGSPPGDGSHGLSPLFACTPCHHTFPCALCSIPFLRKCLAPSWRSPPAPPVDRPL